MKSAKSSKINFDPTFSGRKEVQKNKWTPYCLTEFHGESENNSLFSPREPSFWPKMVLKKTALKIEYCMQVQIFFYESGVIFISIQKLD